MIIRPDTSYLREIITYLSMRIPSLRPPLFSCLVMEEVIPEVVLEVILRGLVLVSDRSRYYLRVV